MSMKKRRVFWGCGAAVLLTAAAVLFFGFQITSVKVEGNSNYTDDEIRKMVLTGPLSGNSILVMILNPDEKTKDAEFIKKVWLERTGNHSIVIHVREKELVGYVRFLDGYLYFDREGILQVSSIKQLADIPYIEGIAIDQFCLGEKLEGLGKDSLSLILSITKMLEKGEWRPDRLVLDEKENLFMYYGNIEVRMGTDENIEEKVSRLLGILPQIQGMEGVLYLENVNSSTKNVTFDRKLSEEEQKALEEAGNEEEQDDTYDSEEYDTQGYDEDYDSYDEDYDSYDEDYDSYDEDYDSYDEDYDSYDEDYDSYDEDYDSYDEDYEW